MAIQELYKLYINDVYHYLLSLSKDKSLAEDLTQDTFMKAYVALHNSQPKALKSWLFKIAYHTFIDYTRRNHKNTFQAPEYFSNIPSKNSSPEIHFLKNREKEELLTKIDQLTPIQKQVITLYDLQGFSYKEISSMLSIKENTLKSHIFRARARLRQMYKKGSAHHER